MSSGNFAYEDTECGVRFTALSLDLASRCGSEKEVDEERDRLKNQLAEVAARMKAALRRRPMMAELPGV